MKKENNWKTEQTLERAVVTLETERIKGSNSWCWWWWWWWWWWWLSCDKHNSHCALQCSSVTPEHFSTDGDTQSPNPRTLLTLRKALAMWIFYCLLQQGGFIWSQFGHDIIYSPLGSFEWHEHISSDIPHIKWDLTNFSPTYITKAQFKSHWVVLPDLSFHKNVATVLCRHTTILYVRGTFRSTPSDFKNRILLSFVVTDNNVDTTWQTINCHNELDMTL